jgi:hypothetical protein
VAKEAGSDAGVGTVRILLASLVTLLVLTELIYHAQGKTETRFEVYGTVFGVVGAIGLVVAGVYLFVAMWLWAVTPR